MDSGFLPAHYETTPRQNYYISLLALSEVREGVAPFMMVPGSLQAARAASQRARASRWYNNPETLGRKPTLAGKARETHGHPVRDSIAPSASKNAAAAASMPASRAKRPGLASWGSKELGWL